MISCFDGDGDLSSEVFLSIQRNNWWRRVSRNSFKSRKEKFWIVMTKANRRIARKACKRESICIFFEKWKVMKSKATFFNRRKNDLNINGCDEWFFWFSFSLLVFEEEIKRLTITSSAAQNDLISKHHFSICLITFRNSNIIFKMFALIFSINDFDVLRLNNWFNFIRIIRKFYIRQSTTTFSIIKKIDAFIVVEKCRLKLNTSTLNSIEKYDDEARSL